MGERIDAPRALSHREAVQKVAFPLKQPPRNLAGKGELQVVGVNFALQLAGRLEEAEAELARLRGRLEANR